MKRLPIVFCSALLAGCSSQPAPKAESATAAPRSIALTSKSPEAIAHFEKGTTHADNFRQAEAAAEFAAALKLDPGFLLAQAEHGSVTPGPDGLKEIESAAAGGKETLRGRALVDRGTAGGPSW